MARKLVKFALVLVVIALVWKVFLGGSAEPTQEVDRID
jgi:hypothetical protein